MQKGDLVSIITPLYNSARFIEEAIKSVQQQTYSNWELVIVDDASSDRSVEIVQKLASNDGRIRLFTEEENKGAAYCRNYAIKQAQGTYMAFLDSDDLWNMNKLEEQISFMKEHDCLVSYTSYVQINEESQFLNKRIIALPQLSYQKQHKNNYIGNLTGIYNAQELGKIYSPNIRKRQDWALWLEAIQRSGKPACGIQKDLAYYRVREESMSSNKVKLLKYNFKFYKEFLGYSYLKSSYWLIRFLFEYFFVRTKYIENY